LRLGKEALAYFDDKKMAWVAEAGTFEVLIGSSSQDIRANAAFTLTESAQFGGPAKARATLSIQNSIKELLDSEEATAILEKHFPGFSTNPQLGMAMGFTLAQLANMAPGQFPKEKLDAVNAELTGDAE
ncbi:MAG: fibronectin type III-like domain-contianing protein, partial [Candidatus Moraniibacteriota bacterium]